MNDVLQQTDEEIAALVQKGDKEKFGALMGRYEQKLSRYARKFLSRSVHIEDAVQEVFIKTYQNIQSFDASQKFSPWIYRIAHNTFINVLRHDARNRLLLVDFDTMVSHPVYEDPAIPEREQREMRAMLDEGLEKLAPHYREILILHYFEELSYKEIADVLHIPIGTVGVRIKRAREALRKASKHAHDHGTR